MPSRGEAVAETLGLSTDERDQIEAAWRREWEALRFTRVESADQISRGGIAHHGMTHVGDAISAASAEARAHRLLAKHARRAGQALDWAAIRAWRDECRSEWERSA